MASLLLSGLPPVEYASTVVSYYPHLATVTQGSCKNRAEYRRYFDNWKALGPDFSHRPCPGSFLTNLFPSRIDILQMSTQVAPYPATVGRLQPETLPMPMYVTLAFLMYPSATCFPVFGRDKYKGRILRSDIFCVIKAFFSHSCVFVYVTHFSVLLYCRVTKCKTIIHLRNIFSDVRLCFLKCMKKTIQMYTVLHLKMDPPERRVFPLIRMKCLIHLAPIEQTGILNNKSFSRTFSNSLYFARQNSIQVIMWL